MKRVRNIAFVVMCVALIFGVPQGTAAQACGTWDYSYFDDCYPDGASGFESWADMQCWADCGGWGVCMVDSWVWDNPCVAVCYCNEPPA